MIHDDEKNEIVKAESAGSTGIIFRKSLVRPCKQMNENVCVNELANILCSVNCLQH